MTNHTALTPDFDYWYMPQNPSKQSLHTKKTYDISKHTVHYTPLSIQLAVNVTGQNLKPFCKGDGNIH